MNEIGSFQSSKDKGAGRVRLLSSERVLRAENKKNTAKQKK
jgi:hypothetical protein